MPTRSPDGRWGRDPRWIVIVSVAVIAMATLLPSRQLDSPTALCVFCGDYGGVDFVLNVALFVPLGVGLALRRLPSIRAWLMIVAATVVIESLQFAIIPGRDASLGDVIANATGGAIGHWLGRHWRSLWRPSDVPARFLFAGALAGWLLVWLASGVALRPAASNSQYYGLLGRPVRGSPPFTGRVLSLAVDGQPVRDGIIRDDRWLRTALLGRDKQGIARVTFLPGQLHDAMSPIVRIADEEGASSLIIGALGRDLVFGVRTGAAGMRLRPPRIRLRGVLGSAGRTDTVEVRSRYAPPHAFLEARSGRSASGIAVPLTPAMGWRLLLPWQTYATDSAADKALNALWLMALVVPAGYWGAFAARTHRRRVITAIVMVLAVGFSAASLLLALAPPAGTELVAVAGGLFVGAILASIKPRRV